MHKLFLQTEHTDVWRHLATEEYLLNSLPADTCILFLWQTADAVVIGKNQNPWLECRFGDLDLAGGKLARRLSGGGAVFHDLGNLNFSFIMWQDDYDKDELSQTVVDAVCSLGIDASVGDRHILQADGRKFSGNAFCLRRKKVIHHGTLLVNVDLDRLQTFLRPTCSGIESKGIRSVPSPVVNLNELKSYLTTNEVADAIAGKYGDQNPAPEINDEEVMALYKTYASDDWLFDRTPRFIVDGSRQQAEGLVRFRAEVVKARIETISSEEARGSLNQFVGMHFSEFLNYFPDLRIS